MAGDLFTRAAEQSSVGKPLAERMRPRSVEDVVGQSHMLGPQGALHQLLQQKKLPSLILWGPPGCGKTTLARLLASKVGGIFESLSAVMSGVKDLRQVMDRATAARGQYGKATVLFIDEIHRFNKAQQDALLPHVESGLVTLIGATTENPAFELNNALLSRCRVMELRPIAAEDLIALLRRALDNKTYGLGEMQLQADDESLATIARIAQGDARHALTTLEVAVELCRHRQASALTAELVAEAAQRKLPRYDKDGDMHHALVSAFIKSMRGSDPDAALYYMHRMLEGGEDPRFILRRVMIFASEDIGNADPQALQTAAAAWQAFVIMGLPEGLLPMTQAVTYLACAPKSNAVLLASGSSQASAQEHPDLPIPANLRNAHTAQAKAQGHGRGYRYPHDYPGHYVPDHYLPQGLAGQQYYQPSDQGAEASIGLPPYQLASGAHAERIALHASSPTPWSCRRRGLHAPPRPEVRFLPPAAMRWTPLSDRSLQPALPNPC